MHHQLAALAIAALCGWAGWSMRRPGSAGLTRALGLLAWAAGSALLDDAFGGLLLGAVMQGQAPDSDLEQTLKTL
ncbi:hypothetical protein ABEG18_14980 [Alsobacter sp. KACC 23698]|uniref:Uncharacterized protein n=1 Tax=Alsobacter sp. KACC 23698 TaxID=3149229 RepID=A0AAU7JA61_9HYPH